MRMKSFCLVVVLGMMSCSSTKFVEQWKNQDTDIYEANKVLVVGITSKPESRRIYEKRLASDLEKKGVNAVKSIDFFEGSFTEQKKSQEQLNNIENQLLEAGFDTVLFTTITGSENRISTMKSFENLNNTVGSFTDYYYDNQYVFSEESEREIYKVYHTETALYCICPGKDRELIWKGTIDIIDPQKIERSVADYIKVLTKELKANRLLILK